MIPATFDYESPRTLGEALALLASRGEEAKFLAGGHSLLPAMKLRLAQPPALIDLGRIPGLAYVREAHERIALGAMTTHATVAASDLLRSACPLLAETAAAIGDVQVRNRGTVGGSLAHADPAADYPAAILALDADLVTISEKGERVVKAREFFTGMFATALRPDEILIEVRVPKTGTAGTSYKKFHHPASGFAVVGVATLVRVKAGRIESASVGITGAAEKAYRATAVEQALRGQASVADAAAHAADGVEALGDHFASSEFRRHLAAVFTRRALDEARARAR
jgi:aerobic carbon-monoxide dehydrogenase medium subunit